MRWERKARPPLLNEPPARGGPASQEVRAASEASGTSAAPPPRKGFAGQGWPRSPEKGCPGLGELGGVPTQAVGASFWIGVIRAEVTWVRAARAQSPPATGLGPRRRRCKRHAIAARHRRTSASAAGSSAFPPLSGGDRSLVDSAYSTYPVRSADARTFSGHAAALKKGTPAADGARWCCGMGVRYLGCRWSRTRPQPSPWG
jgi:hypothetical protein